MLELRAGPPEKTPSSHFKHTKSSLGHFFPRRNSKHTQTTRRDEEAFGLGRTFQCFGFYKFSSQLRKGRPEKVLRCKGGIVRSWSAFTGPISYSKNFQSRALKRFVCTKLHCPLHSICKKPCYVTVRWPYRSTS